MKCILCEIQIKGRADKKFCSIKCKNEYHRILRRKTRTAVNEIDDILHRNYAICDELMSQQRKSKIMVPRLVMEKLGFQFNYCTGMYKNTQNKIYHYIYDYSWMKFSNQDIMLVRNYKKPQKSFYNFKNNVDV